MPTGQAACMHSRRALKGTVVQGDTPSWTALEAAVGSDVAPLFMWMFEIRLEDGARVDAYKHGSSRRYLHLGEDDSAFAYWGESGYAPVDREHAITEVFRGLNSSKQTQVPLGRRRAA